MIWYRELHSRKEIGEMIIGEAPSSQFWKPATKSPAATPNGYISDVTGVVGLTD
jgi:hypothetical protein